MKRLALILPVALAMATLAGCGDDANYDPEPPADGPLIKFSRAGGFAFSIYEVTINEDGSGVAGSGFRPDDLDETSFELSSDEVAELEGVLNENPLPDQDETSTGCADCFTYEVSYGGNTYAYDQAAEPDDAVAAVRAELDKLPIPPDKAAG